MENEDKTYTYKEIKSLNGIPLFVCSKCRQIASWVKPTEGTCPNCGRTIVKEED